MMVEAEYTEPKLTPFRLARDADALVKELAVCFDRAKEEKALILLNAAEWNPKMSEYQMSLSRKALADVYYEAGFFGGALVQYQAALEENPGLSVKRRIKELLSMPVGERTFSASPDIVFNVLQYEEYRQFAVEYHSEYEEIRNEILGEKVEVYDPAFEAEIEVRLSALGEIARTSFYKCRDDRIKPGYESLFTETEEDNMLLEAMERSAAFYANKLPPSK